MHTAMGSIDIVNSHTLERMLFRGKILIHTHNNTYNFV